MPFIPHTPAEKRLMLEALGVSDTSDLFDEIPVALRSPDLSALPEGVSQMQATRLMSDRASQDAGFLNFIGAGAYEHYIPAAVWDIAGRGEYMTAYTPYQAEASQGTLQVIYEFQSMIASLTGMDVANASLYDGSSALAEACLMAMRLKKKSVSNRILLAQTLNPSYVEVVANINQWQGTEFCTLPADWSEGVVDQDMLREMKGDGAAAVVIAQPNFLGQLEAVDALTDWAHELGALVIAVVNPTSLAVLKPPGAWGKQGADIVVGEGQPLGVPLSGGGPYFGFMACAQSMVRQMPGRIVGRTLDLDGASGFTLTLQAREQHIRRAKATSNICTNQGLAVTAATIYMSLMGPAGLKEVALACMRNTQSMIDALAQIDLKPKFSGPRFHEVVIQVPLAAQLSRQACEQGVLAGHALGSVYPQCTHDLLLCATETKTQADIDRLVEVLANGLA